MRNQRLIILVFVFFAVVGSLRAQSTISGYVTGVVTDPSKGGGGQRERHNPES